MDNEKASPIVPAFSTVSLCVLCSLFGFIVTSKFNLFRCFENVYYDYPMFKIKAANKF